jgi:nitrite reductase/ring-hydroxylating ferredoxin subunit
MIPKFLNRNIFQRIFGVPATPRPRDPQCWTLSGRKVSIDLKRAPELEAPGGALRLEGGRLPLRVLIVHGEDGAFYAFHNRCTHLGHRRLDPVPGTGTVQCCSVGKSTYRYDGRKVYGPAPAPIDTLKVELDGERLVVSLE